MAGDLGIHADVIQRARQNGHRDGPRVRAVRVRAAVIVALPGSNSTNDQPNDKKDRSGTHRYLRFAIERETCEVSPVAHRYLACRLSNKPQVNKPPGVPGRAAS